MISLIIHFLDSLNFSALSSQVKVTPAHNEECKKLLTLMGIPYVDVSKRKRISLSLLQKRGILTAQNYSLGFQRSFQHTFLTKNHVISAYSIDPLKASYDFDMD